MIRKSAEADFFVWVDCQDEWRSDREIMLIKLLSAELEAHGAIVAQGSEGLGRLLKTTISIRIFFMSKLFRPVIPITLIALGIGAGCNNQNNIAETTSYTTTVTSIAAQSNLPQVVATTSVLCDLTKQIAAQTVNLVCLIPTNINPQQYQPNPQDSEAIEQAKLIFYHGYNFEPALIKTIKNTQNKAPKIAVAKIAVPKPIYWRRNGKPVPDPHLWHSTKNTIRMVDVISNSLEKTIPENTETYRRNGQALKAELNKLDTWINSRIDSIPDKKRQLITIHEEMAYYTSQYGLEFNGVLAGVSPQEQPKDTRVKVLVKNLKKAKIPTIFAENMNNSNLINVVANQAKVTVSERELLTQNLGEPGSDTDTYQKMMVANTRTIVEGLGGTYLIFEPIAPR